MNYGMRLRSTMVISLSSAFFLALYFNDYLLNGIARLHCVKSPKVVNKKEKILCFSKTREHEYHEEKQSCEENC